MRRRINHYEARQIVALPFYVFGAIFYCVAAGFLLVGDFLGASKHSRELIR